MQFNPSRPKSVIPAQIPSQDPTSVIPTSDSSSQAPVKDESDLAADCFTKMKQEDAANDPQAALDAQQKQMESDRAAADNAMVKQNNENQSLHELMMHHDFLPKKMHDGDIDRLIADPEAPPGLKKGLQFIKDNPEFKKHLDTAGKGGDPDGTISFKDLDAAIDNPRYKQFCEKKSTDFMEKYIPSDAETPEDSKPRKMTAADAYRELYLYSESLPKGIDKDELKDIAQGKSKGKTPPQVMAAAQFLSKNPEALAKIAPDGHLSNDAMEDSLVKHINLNPKEKKVLDTMSKNPDEFFKDGKKLKREELKTMANDPSKSPEVRKAAQDLVDNPVIFGMLDNAKGHGGNLIKKGNDGAISKDDLKLAQKNLTAENTAAPAKHVASSAPKTAEEIQNLQEMKDGALDDPNEKKATGGALTKIAESAMKVWSKVLDVTKGIVDGITGILPGPLKAIGAAISAGIAVTNDLVLKPVAAMLDGKSAKEAYIEGAKEFGMDAASTVAGAIVPGGGAMLAAGVKAGAKEGIKVGIKAGSKEGAEAISRGEVKAIAKEEAKAAAKDEVKAVVMDKATQAAQPYKDKAIADATQAAQPYAQQAVKAAAAVVQAQLGQVAVPVNPSDAPEKAKKLIEAKS
jgi:type III secretion translocon protein HrpF